MNNRIYLYVLSIAIALSGCSMKVESPTEVDETYSPQVNRDIPSERIITNSIGRIRVDNAYNDVRIQNSDGTVQILKTGDDLPVRNYSIEVGINSSATFDIGDETDAGSMVKLMAGPSTLFDIEEFDIREDGSRVYRLSLLRGQAKFSARGFTHEGSEFEMASDKQGGKTIAAVRGTEFGLGVNPVNGNLALSVTEGKVALSREQDGNKIKEVECLPGEQVRVSGTGEVKPIEELDDTPSPTFELEELGDYRYRLHGSINAHNILYIDNTAIDTDADNGEFSYEFSTVDGVTTKEVKIQTPLGTVGTYKVSTTQVDSSSPIINKS